MSMNRGRRDQVCEPRRGGNVGRGWDKKKSSSIEITASGRASRLGRAAPGPFLTDGISGLHLNTHFTNKPTYPPVE